MSKRNTDPLTWFQQHNILPIITALTSAMSVWYALDKRVYLQEQKIQYIAETANVCMARLGQVEAKFYDQSLDIKELQTKGSVKGITTQTSRVTPTPTDDK